MKVAPAIGQDLRTGSLVRITPKPGVPSQLALAAAAMKESEVGSTALPSLLTILVWVSLFCLA